MNPSAYHVYLHLIVFPCRFQTRFLPFLLFLCSALVSASMHVTVIVPSTVGINTLLLTFKMVEKHQYSNVSLPCSH